MAPGTLSLPLWERAIGGTYSQLLEQQRDGLLSGERWQRPEHNPPPGLSTVNRGIALCRFAY